MGFVSKFQPSIDLPHLNHTTKLAHIETKCAFQRMWHVMGTHERQLLQISQTISMLRATSKNYSATTGCYTWLVVPQSIVSVNNSNPFWFKLTRIHLTHPGAGKVIFNWLSNLKLLPWLFAFLIIYHFLMMNARFSVKVSSLADYDHLRNNTRYVSILADSTPAYVFIIVFETKILINPPHPHSRMN